MKLIELNIKSTYRLCLWIITLLLTSVILLFPIHLHFEYQTIESLYIFGDNLWLFALLYITWLASLLLLLFSPISEWQRITLVSIFALVYLCFWVIITPYGSYADGLVNMGHVRYLAQINNIPFAHPMLAYFQFPGIHLTALPLSDISGLDIFGTRTVFLLFSRILFAWLLYILFAKSLKIQALASFSVLLVLQGSLMFSRTEFHAQITAILLFSILLFGLFKYHLDGVTSYAPLVITCFPVLTITYLPLQAFFIFTLGGIYVTQTLNGRRIISWQLIMFCIIMFFLWEAYGATRYFNNMFDYIQNFLSGLFDPTNRLRPILDIAKNKLGESVPLWTSLTRLFWMAFIFLFGVILGIRNLFRLRKLSNEETIETGGLWGILVFSTICIFTFPGATQTQRLFTYGPLFIVPIILMFLINFKVESIKNNLINNFLIKPFAWCTRHALPIMSISLFILSLPTFLVNRPDINTISVYRYELSAGDFVESLYNINNNLRFFTDVQTVYEYSYYIPDGKLNSPLQPWEISGKEGVWQVLNTTLSKFYISKENSVYILTERFDQAYRTISPIEPIDPEWTAYVARISGKNLIYDNHHTQIYLNHTAQ